MKMIQVIKNKVPDKWKRIKIYHILYSLKYFFKTEQLANTFPIDEDTFFRELEIETVNRCNGKCSFCPVNVNEKQRPYAKMTDDLFEKIMTELHERNYSGSICLFSNNEPFLDERIIEFHRYAREKLPRAYLHIFTNGTLLSLDNFKSIIPYLDKIVIDNYSDTFELSENLKPIYEYCQSHSELLNKVTFSMRKQNETLTSRGGTSPNKKNTKRVRAKCFYPFRQAVIRPDGKMSLCCNDALGAYTMGDVNKSTLHEIWNSSYYRTLRKTMKKTGRRELAICKACDAKQYGINVERN